ncbi:MAG TPA: cytochrome P450 [Actinomycetota bacterium]|nr:cytochrome P450 [Actinomycetota bacterium]
MLGGPIGDPEQESADHARLRRLLARPLSPRRLEALQPRIQGLVDGLLDGLAAAGSPADFHALVASRLPLLVVCELLGVPEEQRAHLRIWADDATRVDQPGRSRAGLQSMWRLFGGLVERKRWSPGEDLVSDLLAAAATDPSLSDDAIAYLAAGALFAGTATVVSTIDRGALLLLTHPDQATALIADPGLVVTAVEEIIRFPSPLDPPQAARRGGLPRYAADDIAIGGVTIRRGDFVMFALQEANLEPDVFPDPTRFDITRRENPHLAFSHGRHFCIGAPLARIELQALFATLFQRFPGLRLAVPLGKLQPLPDRVAGAVAELPVAW